MKKDDLNKIDVCRHLLPEPGNIVVGELIDEIRTLRKLVEAVYIDYGGYGCCSDVAGKNWFDIRDKVLG